MLMTHSEKGKGVSLDVTDMLCQEMYWCVVSKSCPSLGPYIMTFLHKYWEAKFPGQALIEYQSVLIPHARNMLKIKKHKAPLFENKEKGKMENEYAPTSD